MSRIGKKAVAIPSGVTANVEGQTVKVKGPKGELQLVLHDDVAAKMDKGAIKVDPRSETKRARSSGAPTRTLVANLMTGVTKGFEQKLEINGVGYRAAVQGKNLQLAARLQPRHRLSDPGRHHDRDAEADRDRRSPASTSRRSARSPPRSAISGRRSPTRARA